MGRRVDLCESCEQLLQSEKENGYHYKCSLDTDVKYAHVDNYHKLDVPPVCPEYDNHDLDYGNIVS